MRHGTYSIVARDPDTGELGVAVQSHWFSVGSLVLLGPPRRRRRRHAVGRRARARPERARADGGGRPAADALARVLAGDELRDGRQVGIVDAEGGVAAHRRRLHRRGGPRRRRRTTMQANMMARDDGPGRRWRGPSSGARRRSPSACWRRSTRPRRAGGDVRGRQSAAMLVVAARGEPWRERIDLRVEDPAHPLRELHRLLDLHRAYELADEADELLAAGNTDAAGERYEQAQRLAPESDELLFWAGLARPTPASSPRASTPSAARPRSTRAGSRCSRACRRSSHPRRVLSPRHCADKQTVKREVDGEPEPAPEETAGPLTYSRRGRVRDRLPAERRTAP